MNQSANCVVASIFHSPLMSLPIISDLFYLYQLRNIHKLSAFCISAKKTKLRDTLLKQIFQKKIIILKTHKLGSQLRSFNTDQVIFDAQINLKRLTKAQVQDVKWSVLLSGAISAKSQQSIEKILPKTIQRSKRIFIPLHVPISEYCDFVMKTAQTLLKQRHQITVISQKNSLPILTNLPSFFGQLFFYRYMIFPFSFLPKSLKKNYKLLTLEQKLNAAYFSLIFRIQNAELLWGFDHENLELFKMNTDIPQIYDCVDYFSSTDSKTNKNIIAQEKELIELSTYFFVNSKTLQKLKQSIKEPIVVKQGFSYHEFNDRSELSSEEQKAITDLKKYIATKKPKIILGFVGNLNYRLDFQLIKKVLQRDKDIVFIFTNAMQMTPTEDKTINTLKKISELKSLPNTYFIKPSGNKTYINTLIKMFDVATIPYDTSIKFNKYCYPMKLFEYFSANKPILSTPILELKRFPKFVTIAETSSDWLSYISTYKKPSKTAQQAMHQLAYENRWEVKVSEILSKIHE